MMAIDQTEERFEMKQYSFNFVIGMYFIESISTINNKFQRVLTTEGELIHNSQL